MHVLFKLIYKDFLILIRDKSGLVMLFVMPAALVLIMTSLQDSTFRALNESGINLILLNHDNDSLGSAIEKEIVRSNIFKVHNQINDRKPTDQMVRESVASGRFQIGLIIPRDATQHIRNRVKSNLKLAFSGTQVTGSPADSVCFLVYLDPTTRASLRSTLQGSLYEYTSRIESRIVMHELSRELNRLNMFSNINLDILQQETIYYREEYATTGNRKIIPNSVQHNVSAWTLFAIFFIVIPFAGAMIKERGDGNLSRLLTMPCSYAAILGSKTIVYLVVCWMQFMLIVAMGLYLFPVFNLPSLSVGGQLGILSVLTLTAALAAIAYGIAIGTIARTHQQASIFASISVVIMAAIGGIWVPVFMMPPLMRHLSTVSPLNWGLYGFYDILIRDARFVDILPKCLYLLTFSLGCLIISLYYHKFRKEYF